MSLFDPAKINRRQLNAELMLISVTLFWGATFPIVKDAITEVPVLCFLWVRFAIAALLLAPLAGRSGFTTLDRRGWLAGLILGGLLFLSYLFQTYGLALTSSSNAGFLTGLNVIWVPLLTGPLLKKPAATGSKIGVVLAIIGLFMLTWRSPWSVNPGDLLVLICSLFIALHILGLDVFTRGYDGRALTCVQIGTMALLAGAGSLVFEPVSWPRTWTLSLLSALMITAVFATAYAFWAMTTFQNRTTPTRAALIYTLEPVFAAIFSIWLAGDRLSTLAWFGGALILAGMIVAEGWSLTARHRRQRRSPNSSP
ncbi:DMT family transporter [Pelovirga terrestris]|uniref:DMT family transporter n=1 Tax=Pelovirga terrestris TaxID=2771352 RepID=A0A8J6QN69_9BACT|nr:DMT family transporter [Pelovirga terrestris]MBD1399266.1 DMT family transporter [Pelovirga terrestris]